MTQKLINFKQNIKPIYFDLACGMGAAVFFSAFIYLEHMGITLKFFNTLFALFSLALLLYIPKRSVLMAGFFIGLLWFYWIGYSFKYNEVGFLTPIITFAFALIYMLFFGVLALSDKVYLRAFLLFGLSFFEPFDFNWLQIELVFVNSYIGVFKYQLALVLLALSLPAYMEKLSLYAKKISPLSKKTLPYTKKTLTFMPLLLLLLALNIHPPLQKDAPLRIKLVATDIKQDQKWLAESKDQIIQNNINEIIQAIHEGYDVVVLPESTFPLFMNMHPYIETALMQLSHKISIVAGALLRENNQHYNVTYFFENGKMQVAKKLVLVPFGEYVPLPKFAQKIINDYFFAGQSDFSIAKEPTDFVIKGITFRNAICYESTCQEIYAGKVDFIIATSNNAWFAPSIEPTLQKLLMQYYARKNGVTIYHSANYKGSGIIK